MIKNIGANLDKIITKLNTISAITTLVPGGIFAQKPMREIANNYIFLNLISEKNGTYTNLGALQKIARISFSLIAKDSSIPIVDLHAIFDTIDQNITDEGSSKISDWSGFSIYGVEAGNISPPLYDKSRCVLVKDYFFIYYGI